MKRIALFPLAALVLTACQHSTEPVPSGAPHAPTLGVVNDQDCVPPPPDPVSWWPGDGNADDVLGGNDGALMNGTGFAAGKVDQAFWLDGTNDFIQVEDSPALNLTRHSIDAWINAGVQLSPAFHGIVVKQNPDNTGRNYYLGLTPEPARLLHYSLSYPSPFLFLNSTSTVPDRAWTHVAATYDGRIMSIYINGQLNASLDLGPSVPANVPGRTSEPLLIGHSNEPASTFFNGLIDEVEIYNRALSAGEVLQIFEAGSAGKCRFIPVDIDIKPGSDPNCFNNDGHGVIPVAILGSADFDVLDVDPATVQLEGLAVQARGKSNKLQAHIEDVNHDGLDDLVVQIEDVDGSFTSGSGTATLTGNLFDGTKIEGSDEICVVP